MLADIFNMEVIIQYLVKNIPEYEKSYMGEQFEAVEDDYLTYIDNPDQNYLFGFYRKSDCGTSCCKAQLERLCIY